METTARSPKDFEGDPDELKEILGEWDEWFSIDDGLKTIDGLIPAIKNDPCMARIYKSRTTFIRILKHWLVVCAFA